MAENRREMALNWHSSALSPQIILCYNKYSQKFAEAAADLIGKRLPFFKKVVILFVQAHS